MSDSDLMCTPEAAQLRATPSSDAKTLVDNCDADKFVKIQNDERQGGEKGRTHGGTKEFGICSIDGVEWAAPKVKLGDNATSSISPVEMPSVKGGGFTTDFGDGTKVSVGAVEMPTVKGDGFTTDLGDGMKVTVRPVE